MTHHDLLITAVLEGAAAVLLTYSCWSYLTDTKDKRVKGIDSRLVGPSSAISRFEKPLNTCCGGLGNSRPQCSCSSSFAEIHSNAETLSPADAKTSATAPTTSASGCGEGCGSCSSKSAQHRSDTAGRSVTFSGRAATILYLSQTDTSKKLAEELGMAMRDAQMSVQVGPPGGMGSGIFRTYARG